MTERSFDIVLFGATGFTGQLVAEYLLERYGSDGELRWALAGRNLAKLESVRQTLQGVRPKHPLTLITADSGDLNALTELAASTRVVCSTVGPYAQHGSELVAACAAQGTDYCDLTGEVPWIARMIGLHQGTAQESGARIVHCCGFDSVPSDLGNWFVQQAMQEQHGVTASRVRGRVGKTRGAASGGTVASLLGVMEEAGRDPALRNLLRDKYCLYPEHEEPGPLVKDQYTPVFDPCFEQWTTPFVMALINERVVRRSNALLDFPWGRGFNYDESQLCSSRAQALAISLGMGAAMLIASNTLGRNAMARWLPKPGEGPDRDAREKGFFELFFHAEHPEDSKKSLRARVSGDRDPGYGSTSRMLGEAAVSLAKDPATVAGGIWTPASALAPALIPRLEQNAGLQFSLISAE
ncbi:saccharopine dehydrogenase NADP-binding domain-containing protein [Congregibacter variabilis]|uniref:Saccharopine dehydrogenase NADP-binding domain-containing protein n=1 Tax=Congregibacter variabilis TaxID=3081200 RepID=A0ABZ0I6C9_9GAMM|nr:saccharopine dehydrogenase NADP-binding domain-containing protein [Congregibacter sp. IMCC43200]